MPGIYAGGDIAHAPVLGKGSASIGHWQLAHYHGHLAAKNILGQNKPIHTVPFFWTMLFGRSVRYAGNTIMFFLNKINILKQFKLKLCRLK